MKRTSILFLYCFLSLIAVKAQQQLNVFNNNGSVVSYPVSLLDSMTFSTDEKYLYLFKSGGIYQEFAIGNIDSLNFTEISNKIVISYQGDKATVINPLESKGVSVVINGANVVVNSTATDEPIIVLQGSSQNGSVKIYSSIRFELMLNGLTLTNPIGPAINIQSKKRIAVTLVDGTTSTIADGAVYANSIEDQKGCFFSEGQLVFSGTGELSVSSQAAHAISCDDYIRVNSGTIYVTAAAKDGIHAKDYFRIDGGVLSIIASSDGIDCEGNLFINGGELTINSTIADTKGITSDSTIMVSGGTVKLIVSGLQSKAVRAKQDLNITGGTFNIQTSGGVALVASGSGYDPSYSTAFKVGANATVSNTSIVVSSSGIAGKGFSVDGDLTIHSGTINVKTTGNGSTYKNSSNITDSYCATCINVDGNLLINGGEIVTTSSGTGGKGVSVDGNLTIGSNSTVPYLSVTTTGSKFLVSGKDYCSGKAIKSDGAMIIHSGIINISSADDGMKSETSVTINNGNITISKSYEGIESKYINMNGGSVDVTSSDDVINATMGTIAGGTEQSDGSCFYMNGGVLSASSTAGDAIDSNGNVEINGGVIVSNGPAQGVEEAIDVNGNALMNGGICVMGGSNSNMTKSFSNSSKQPNLFITSRSAVSSSTLISVEVNGQEVITFRPKYGAYKFHFSSPEMVKGASYAIYTGGSYSGGTATNGFLQGGSYTKGTSKKTGTLSATTTVNSISF